MIRKKLSTNACLFFLLGTLLLASCQKTEKLPPLASDAVILAFGDSLTYGTGASRTESYPAILATLTGRKVINAGIPGEVSAAGRARLSGVLDETQPALLLLCLGGNDFLRRLDPVQVKENLRAMVQDAKERGIVVVLIAVPTLGFGLQVPPLYAVIASEAGIPLEGEILAEILSDSALKSDPIHPNAAGYNELAIALEKLLRRSAAL
ncbi:MAG: arylesterase [Desulfuromonadales bacterium]|nr:arylesterase [Desulfuromonadales bacterium]